jgi:nicotinate-nucleotide--dimethylbenzimidazole phosphoribosyltransferase
MSSQIVPFSDLKSLTVLLSNAPAPDQRALASARARNSQLTKPAGALGRLEDIAIWMAGWQARERPNCESLQVLVFAGNHGVTAQGISAFPSDVTAQMVANFETGGAAINQLCHTFGADLTVVPLALDRPTADFTSSPAMTDLEFLESLAAGWSAVDPDADVLVTGEMGIGNTTSAAAISYALYGGAPEDWCGRGTGVDDDGLARKAAVLARAIQHHKEELGEPLDVLRRLGGRELAAMTGAIARARVERIPVVLDGFICTAAAACLEKAVPGSLDHALAGHLSDERAHGMLLDRLGKAPLLSLGLRLGEGSGAALALGILKGAVACHSGMATFGEAGVSDS